MTGGTKGIYSCTSLGECHILHGFLIENVFGTDGHHLLRLFFGHALADEVIRPGFSHATTDFKEPQLRCDGFVFGGIKVSLSRQPVECGYLPVIIDVRAGTHKGWGVIACLYVTPSLASLSIAGVFMPNSLYKRKADHFSWSATINTMLG